MTFLTLPEIARRTGANYRTLHSWVERGWITPSINRTRGAGGDPNMYSEEDAARIAQLVRLQRAGLSTRGLERALREPDQLVRDLVAAVENRQEAA